MKTLMALLMISSVAQAETCPDVLRDVRPVNNDYETPTSDHEIAPRPDLALADMLRTTPMTEQLFYQLHNLPASEFVITDHNHKISLRIWLMRLRGAIKVSIFETADHEVTAVIGRSGPVYIPELEPIPAEHGYRETGRTVIVQQ